MNFQDLQNLVSFWVDDLQFGYFTPVQVQRFLNDAQRQVQKYLIDAGQNFYVKRACTELVINQRDYQLPADLIQINRLEIVISGLPPNEMTHPLHSITINEQDRYAFSQGTPEAYYLTRSAMILWPAPDTPYELRVIYTYRVADMINPTDVPDVPEDFHEFIAILAALDCYVKDGRESQLLMNKQEAYLAELKRLAD